jgi:chromosome segregation ATPase
LARACTGAARELKAAQAVIKACNADIASADEQIAIAQLEIATLKRIGALSAERARELENVIAAERAKIEALQEKIDLQETRRPREVLAQSRHGHRRGRRGRDLDRDRQITGSDGRYRLLGSVTPRVGKDRGS